MSDEHERLSQGNDAGPSEDRRTLLRARSEDRCCEEDRYQTDLLVGIIRRMDLANCHLEKIAEQSCHALNELHWQTVLQTRMSQDISRLLAIAETKEPAVARQLDELERLKRKVEECCPPEDREPSICHYVPCGQREEDEPGRRDAKPGTAHPKRVEGAPYEPLDPGTGPHADPNDRPHREVPQGPFRGILREMPASDPGAADDQDSGIDFGPWTTDPTVAPASTNAADISGADAGEVVMLTGNTYADYSTDGGQTFTTINPTAVFPNTLAGGICCDQVVQYVPEIDRFVWLMQYRSTAAGDNAYRLAAASPQDIIDSNCTRWTYWDFTSGTFGFGTDWMDYPSLAVGSNSLYMSFDVLDSTPDSVADNGLVVARLPLDAIQASATINFWFTNPPDGLVAWGSNVTQNTGNEVFWAGHIDNSTMRVFSWREDSTTYFWRSVEVANWPNGTRTSLGPNGNNWFQKVFPNNAVIGATRQGDLIWFAWMASSGDGGNGGFNFPHPHVQVAKVRIGSYDLVDQMTIWNPDFAFGYPCFATNSDAEVGVALGWGGGGTRNANSAVGFMGDYVVWYRDGSTYTHTRWGDYVSVRQSAPDGRVFAGFGYVELADATTTAGYRFEPYFVRFARQKVQPPPIR
jgi:hypothetical protein